MDMTAEAIAILRVADAAVAATWYRRLGFVSEWEHRLELTFPAFVSIARTDGGRLFLSEHRGDARPFAFVLFALVIK